MITLRPHQQEMHDKALPVLQEHKLVYLAGEMRTGKTLTSLFLAQSIGATSVLLFTKKKAISSIKKDYKAAGFTYNFKCQNYEKVNAYQTIVVLDNGDEKPGDFRTDAFYKDFLTPDLVILDEAHSLGQYPVQARKVDALKDICKGCPVIFLSGSPSPESYSQLYHQFYVSTFSPFLAWQSFYNWAGGVWTGSLKKGTRIQTLPGFVNKKTEYHFGRQHIDYSDANKELIDQYTKHLFITMTQKKAGFEVVVTDTILTVKMAASTYALADRLMKDRVVKGNDGSVVLGDTEVKLQQKLHQIYSGTVVCEPEMIHVAGTPPDQFKERRVSKCFDRTKANFIKERFSGQKIAILYCFVEELVMLQATFGYAALTDDPETFARSSHKVIFAAQVVSAREGVNLSCADCLIFLNISFSALSYIQGRQRMQDQLRTAPSVCYWIFAEGGIEQKIYERVINKMDYTLEYFREDFGKQLNLSGPGFDEPHLCILCGSISVSKKGEMCSVCDYHKSGI